MEKNITQDARSHLKPLTEPELRRLKTMWPRGPETQSEEDFGRITVGVEGAGAELSADGYSSLNPDGATFTPQVTS